VLPAVEITTAHGHVLVYFAPRDAGNIRNLLAKIDIKGPLGEPDSHTAMSMADVIREAERLGGISIAAHIDRVKTGFEMLATGYPAWKGDIINSSGLYGLECDDAANLIWYTENDDSTATGAERKKLLAARGGVSALIGRASLAHLQGSDAHTLAQFTTGRADKLLTRFKLNELSFDAFRTALSDCEARVRAVATIPKSLPRILGMQITSGFLNGEIYHFSDNLNCFIGGRGTGKSTALQSLAYGLDLTNELETHDNCPGTVVVYCEDENGMQYRYERLRGKRPTVVAKRDKEITDVPADAFQVEYYPQGELSAVAKDPLKNPSLLQEFLDRHLLLSDLVGKEEQLVTALDQNSAQLITLEVSAAQLTKKADLLAEINKKLAIAEEGKLKEIAAVQDQLSNEKNLAVSLGEIRDQYDAGIDFSDWIKDFDDYEEMTKPLTGAPASNAALLKIKEAMNNVNKSLSSTAEKINKTLKTGAREMTVALGELQRAQKTLEAQINVKITELQKKGLAGTIADHQARLKQKSAVTQEINKIKGQATLLARLRKSRSDYLKELAHVRTELTQRRKDQLKSINENLAATIEDYTVFVHYEPSGITDEFCAFIREKMRGSYFQEDMADKLCSQITPPRLATLLLGNDAKTISAEGGVAEEWANEICQKLRRFQTVHALQSMWKPPCPVITARTKGARPRDIPINQLSDGQKHTILLTIAMLAESNIL